jgi:hypothetical protein
MNRLTRARASLSVLLMVIGAALIGAGVFYWWKGWWYAPLVLRFCAAHGALLLGAGALVRRASAATLATALSAFATSTALHFTLWAGFPWAAGLHLTLALVSSAGVVASLALLARRRRVR